MRLPHPCAASAILPASWWTCSPRGLVYLAPNLPVTEYLLAGNEEGLVALIAEKQLTDPTIEVCQPGDFAPELLAGLSADLAKIEPILADWQKVVADRIDPKLDKFVDCLKTELLDRSINHEGRKLVVFSESAETTTYLRDQLHAAGFEKILAIDSSNRSDRMDDLRANFDANIPASQRRNDHEILISTEVLSEGVNLHRANIVVNYDTPWNATRLMQRIGRVNRIGTAAPRIYIYNFYPTSRVDDDIELKKKAIMKLQAFHTALGEDSQIYSTEEEVDSFGLFERTPEESEKDERLVRLMELRRFRAENPEQFRRIDNLPVRCRVGRADSARALSTVAFLRNRHRDAFYRLRPNTAPEEISFLDAADEFRAPDPAEPAVPLHGEHHAQVSAAVEAFEQQVLAETLAPQMVEVKAGPNERRALAYLDGFLAFDFLSDAEKKIIRLAKQAIARARFQNLQRQVNELHRDTKKVKVTPAALTDKLMEILRGFPLAETEPASVAADERPVVETLPDIILSESFA